MQVMVRWVLFGRRSCMDTVLLSRPHLPYQRLILSTGPVSRRPPPKSTGTITLSPAELPVSVLLYQTLPERKPQYEIDEAHGDFNPEFGQKK